MESVDHVYQKEILDKLKATGRPENLVGWAHSHPGFGCWLSGVDVNTQQSFEQLNPRCVAVVIDPIQSVKGKVVISAFRLIDPQRLLLGQEPRQTTSNLGSLQKPSIQALIHGLNRHYYAINITYRKSELEERMLLNLHKEKWTKGLALTNFGDGAERREETLRKMVKLSGEYDKWIGEEGEMGREERVLHGVGVQDPRRQLSQVIGEVIGDVVVQRLTTACCATAL